MIAILLSTFNGGKYLKEQIDSLINQDTKEEWKLYIRDDGSQDNTIDIINYYTSNYTNIINCSDGINLGPAKSFMKLLETIEADYYMFCDQDDYWYPNKISSCIHHLDYLKDSINIPILIHTNLEVVDDKLNLLSNSFWKRNLDADFVNKYLSITNFMTGCTMFFNKKARDLCISYKNNDLIMHDYWLAICVWANNGLIITDNKPSIKYRQHDNNVLGAFKKQESIKEKIVKSIRHNLRVYKMVNKVKNISLIKYFIIKVSFVIDK